MLPASAKKNKDSYSFANGMYNIGWIGGVLRHPDNDKGTCFLQQTASENHMIPIEFNTRKCHLPRGVKEWDIVVAYCRIEGVREGDTRALKLRALHFENANLLHADQKLLDSMHKEWQDRIRAAADALGEKWQLPVHENAPKSEVPPALKEVVAANPISQKERVSGFDWRAGGLNRNATNHVQLAGFVHAKSLERDRYTADGRRMHDRLLVLLRQTENPDFCIPIRWYQKNLDNLAEKLSRGMAISVIGEVRMDVKAIGVPDPETNIAPVSAVPFIQAKDFPQGVKPDSGLIRIFPAWAIELYSQPQGRTAQARPAAPPKANGAAKGNGAAKADEGIPAVAPPEPGDAESTKKKRFREALLAKQAGDPASEAAAS